MSFLYLISQYERTRKNLRQRALSFYRYNLRILFFRVLIRVKYSLIIKLHLTRFLWKSLFISADIETYGYCNRTCEFCFNNPKFKQREKGVMPEEIWKRIIDELLQLKYKGRISPHFYGEPLLDKRLCDLVSYARKKCPSAYILIDTNGDLLDESLVKKLYSNGLNKLFVTSYDEEIPERLLFLKNTYPALVHIRGVNDFHKVNRSGKIFGHKTKQKSICYNPSFQLIINWQGDVLLCCMDYYKEVSFGNVDMHGIRDIWFSEDFTRVRHFLRKGQREKITICTYCDHDGAVPW